MTPIDICNQALAHIGDRRISRLDEDAQATDALVRYCSEFYLQARTEALAAHRWTFAKKSAVMVRRTGVPQIGKFQYVHVLPTDCLRLMSLIYGTLIEDETEPSTYTGQVTEFEINGRDVRSNEQYLAIKYIADVTNPSDWSPHFRGAVSHKLAHYLAGAIGDNLQLASQQLDVYERVALPNAQFYDAVQDNSGENNDRDVRRAYSPLLRARYSTGYGANGPDDA